MRKAGLVGSRFVAKSVAWLVGGSVLFLAGTYAYLTLYAEAPRLPPLGRVLVQSVMSQLSLQGENVLAAWFSSMSMLLAGVAAATCFALERRTPAGRGLLSIGWLILAGVFLLLSLDELGSLHERIGAVRGVGSSAGESAPPGWVVLLAPPIGVVAAFMAAFARARLRRFPAACALMLLGVALFLTVPLQELIEISLFSTLGASRRPALLSVLEEGTELAGVIAFVAAFLLVMARLHRATGAGVRVSELSWRACCGATAIIGSVALLAALATSPAYASISRDDLWTASSFNGALVTRNVDLALALAADDVQLRVLPVQPGGEDVYVGKATLAGWLQQSRDQRLTLQQAGVTIRGGTFTWRGTATQESWSAQGLDPLRSETTVALRDGKVAALTLHLGAPPGEILGLIENWFASAASALAALFAWTALRLRSPRWPPEQLGLALLAPSCLAFSAYIGANGPAYIAGQDLIPRLIAELVRGALIASAVIMSIGRASPWDAAWLVGGAVVAGAGIGLGGPYAPGLSWLGTAAVCTAVSRIALDPAPAVVPNAPTATLVSMRAEADAFAT